MPKLHVIVLCLLLLAGCRGRTEGEGTVVSEEIRLQSEELPGKFTVNSRARVLLSGWPEFLALENSLDAVYRVENQEDLRLLLDELLEKEKALAAGSYPELFNTPQVFSRQKVFKTYLLKARAQLEYRRDPTEAVHEMLEAYNALCREFNVLVNNTLESELIEDE